MKPAELEKLLSRLIESSRVRFNQELDELQKMVVEFVKGVETPEITFKPAVSNEIRMDVPAKIILPPSCTTQRGRGRKQERVSVKCQRCGDTYLVRPSEVERTRYCAMCVLIRKRSESFDVTPEQENARLEFVNKIKQSPLLYRQSELLPEIKKLWPNNEGLQKRVQAWMAERIKRP